MFSTLFFLGLSCLEFWALWLVILSDPGRNVSVSFGWFGRISETNDIRYTESLSLAKISTGLISSVLEELWVRSLVFGTRTELTKIGVVHRQIWPRFCGEWDLLQPCQGRILRSLSTPSLVFVTQMNVVCTVMSTHRISKVSYESFSCIDRTWYIVPMLWW